MRDLFTDESYITCRVKITPSMNSDWDDQGGDMVIKYKTWLEKLFNILGFQFEPVIVLETDNYEFAEPFVWYYDFFIRKIIPGFERYADLFSCAYFCLEDFLRKVSRGNVGFLLFDSLKDHCERHNFNFAIENYRRQIGELQSKIDYVANSHEGRLDFSTELFLPSPPGLPCPEGIETNIENQPEAASGLRPDGRESSPSPTEGQNRGTPAGQRPLSSLPPSSESPVNIEIGKTGPPTTPPSNPEPIPATGDDKQKLLPRPRVTPMPPDSDDDLFLTIEAEINLLPLDYGPIEFYIEKETVTYPMDREDISRIYKNLKKLKKVFIDLERTVEGEVRAKLVEIIEES